MYLNIINDMVLMKMTIIYLYKITLIYNINSVKFDLNISGGNVLGN